MASLTPPKRKRIEALILDTMSALDKTGKNTARYREDLKAMSDAKLEAWLKKLQSDEDEHFYLEVLPYDNSPSLDDVERAAKIVGVELHQYVYFRHDGAKDKPVRSKVRVPVGHIHVRRLQQLLMKKTTYSTDVSKRSQITGQLSGDAAVGRIADEEAYALKTVGAEATVAEMFGPRADNRQKRLQLYHAIDRDGYVQYQNLRGDIKDQPGVNYLDALLLAAGLKSDLVDGSELLRVSADRPVEKQR